MSSWARDREALGDTAPGAFLGQELALARGLEGGRGVSQRAGPWARGRASTLIAGVIGGANWSPLPVLRFQEPTRQLGLK